MNNILYKYRLLLLFLLCSNLLACTSFLEESVDNRATIESIDELKASLVSVLPTPEHLFTEFMTDDYSLSQALIGDRYEEYLPIYEFRITKDNPANSWFNNNSFNPNYSYLRYYYYIHNSALIIDRANGFEDQGSASQELVNSIKGQALAIKAYCHFMIVNTFAKQYNAETAGDDYAPPYISSYSGRLITKYPESNVKEFYVNIEADLLASLKLIRNNMPNDKFYFTTNAVHALLTRLYLYKKEWGKVIEHANIIRGNSVLNIKKLAAKHDVAANNVNKAHYSADYFNPDNESYLLMSNRKENVFSSVSLGIVPTPLYEYMFIKNRDGNKEFTDYGMGNRNFVPIKFNSSSISVPLLSLDEVYYNRSEAYVQKGDLGNAKKDLQFLLSNDNYTDDELVIRLTELNDIGDKNQLLNFLLESKRMRFFSEGMRWFDMKRYNLPVTHTSVNNIFLIDGNDPMDYVIKIPLNEIVD